MEWRQISAHHSIGAPASVASRKEQIRQQRVLMSSVSHQPDFGGARKLGRLQFDLCLDLLPLTLT